MRSADARAQVHAADPCACAFGGSEVGGERFLRTAIRLAWGARLRGLVCTRIRELSPVSGHPACSSPRRQSCLHTLPLRPLACAELRALTQNDPVAAETAAAVGAGCDAAASAVHSTRQPMLGSIAKLSPVRASKKVVGSLGADAGQVRGWGCRLFSGITVM